MNTCVSKAILIALENNISYYEPINIGTGNDISIKLLAELIAKLVGYKGNIIFTNEVSNGQPKRLLDISRAKEVLNWEPDIELEDGLRATIDWYQANKDKL
jgi:nucleoside-diphosphate-sugar epimerase